MSKAVFQRSDIELLVEELNNATKFSPSLEMIFDPECYIDGVILDVDGNQLQTLEAAIKAEYEGKLDRSRFKEESVYPSLMLVKDHGLYLMTNAIFESDTKRKVVYAIHCDPEKDQDWWQESKAIFGADDGAIFLDRSNFINMDDDIIGVAIEPHEDGCTIGFISE